MTIKELIEILQTFPDDMIVLSWGNDEHNEPAVYQTKIDLRRVYWDGKDFKYIEPNQEHVMIQ